MKKHLPILDPSEVQLHWLINQYKTALSDAIRRPMGVVPDSAHGLVTQYDLDAAEARRARIASPSQGGDK